MSEITIPVNDELMDAMRKSAEQSQQSVEEVARRGLQPILRKAGIVPRYGLHSLRHAAASLWIESGMNAKRIQTLMGHSSIQLTFDRYGHLFANAEGDQKAAEDIQVRLLGK
jgi:integrase